MNTSLGLDPNVDIPWTPIMYKIKIITIGKLKEPWLAEALQEYTNRLKTSTIIEWILVKDDEKLKNILEKEGAFFCLDPSGSLLTSEAFSTFLLQTLESQGSRMTLVIGGSDGIPKEIKTRASRLLSLSPMTFTHQMTRLILLEQIYRALEIARGSPYHK